jgi:hypothetical protein
MLTNIRRSPNVLRAITNGGHQDSCLLGDFPNLGPVWFNSESIANILSLSEVRKVCRVTMDTEEEAAMCVHRLDGSVMKFVEHDNGLYVFVPNSSADVTGYTLVSTVADNKRMFTQREIRNADLARELYRKIGRPNEAEFQSILRRNLIRNCPVTPDDARRALIIYGPDIAALKGRRHTHPRLRVRQHLLPCPYRHRSSFTTAMLHFASTFSLSKVSLSFTPYRATLGSALLPRLQTAANQLYGASYKQSFASIVTAALRSVTFSAITSSSASVRRCCLSS